ncbi:ras guanine nucleotide exchange factor domain-containing protein [Gaertneriomyces semiglobifer]|nr:ras guanine nucleotide exchange factor domain-containing protein [Gaertneriomyces semiglobifer]
MLFSLAEAEELLLGHPSTDELQEGPRQPNQAEGFRQHRLCLRRSFRAAGNCLGRSTRYLGKAQLSEICEQAVTSTSTTPSILTGKAGESVATAASAPYLSPISPTPASETLPAIPTSPLLHQHRLLTEQYQSASSQLKALEASQDSAGRPYAATAAALAQVRRLVDLTGVTQQKLSNIQTVLAGWDWRSALDIDVEILGRAIVHFDVDMFRAIRQEDLAMLDNRALQPMPSSIARALDFARFLQRIVQWTILESNRPEATIAHWISIAKYVGLTERDYQGMRAIVLALEAIAISRLALTWKKVSKKHRTAFKEFKTMMSGMDGWRYYKVYHLEKCQKPAIPIVDVLITESNAEARRLIHLCLQNEQEWDRLYPNFAESNPDVGPMHWLVTRPWMTEDQLMDLSLKREEPSVKLKRSSRAGTPSSEEHADRFRRLNPFSSNK